jgi:hypothetical protein
MTSYAQLQIRVKRRTVNPAEDPLEYKVFIEYVIDVRYRRSPLVDF